jgi:DNA uptake protein ComE-like DNA-binding protein
MPALSSPAAPQWFKLRGKKVQSEIITVYTQAITKYRGDMSSVRADLFQEFQLNKEQVAALTRWLASLSTSSSCSTFSLKHSALTEEKKGLWVSKQLSGELNEVPGIGKATIQKLREHNIHNTFQLIGDMLKFVEKPFADEKVVQSVGDTYKKRLVTEFGCNARHVDTVIHALVEKIGEGFKVQGVPMPQSAITEEQWARLRAMANKGERIILSGNIAQDVLFIGPQRTKSLASHETDPITNTFQLVGLFLEFYTGPGHAESDLKAFEEKLKSYGGLRVREVAAQLVNMIGSGIQLRTEDTTEPNACAVCIPKLPDPPHSTPSSQEKKDELEEEEPGKKEMEKKKAENTEQKKTGTMTKQQSPSFTSTAVMMLIALFLLFFIKFKLGL